MEKRVISEINQMKYLVNYRAGRVISEQIRPSEPISEQLFSRTKEDDVDIVFSTQDPKLVAQLNKMTLANLRKEAGIPYEGKKGQEQPSEEALTKFNATVQSMMEKMDELSQLAFSKLSQTTEEFLQKFYLYVVASYIGSNFGGLKTVKNQKIVVDNYDTIKQELVKKGKAPGVQTVEEPGYSLQQSQDIDSSDFFVDNEAVLTTNFVNFVNENIVTAVEGAKEALKPLGGTNTGSLINMDIKSSCSRLPNGPSKTFGGKTPSFEELALKRAEVARDYILKVLNQNGITTDNANITIDAKGENGDGTSGPAWNNKNTDRPKYDQYKYVKVNLDFVINTSVEAKASTVPTPGTPDEYVPKSVDDYTIKFTALGRTRVKIGLPRFKFRIPRIRFSRGMAGTPKYFKCPKIRNF